MLWNDQNLRFRMVNIIQECDAINILWNTTLCFPRASQWKLLRRESWPVGNRSPNLWNVDWANSFLDQERKRFIQDHKHKDSLPGNDEQWSYFLPRWLTCQGSQKPKKYILNPSPPFPGNPEATQVNKFLNILIFWNKLI